jgi:type IV pilus assembly protein PilY1
VNKKFFGPLSSIMVGLLLAGATAQADDIEIYLKENENSEGAYVHLMLDYRPSVFNNLCSYDTSCKPPFMSDTAYSHLEHTGGSVSTFQAFVAVMAAVFENDKFDPINMALIMPNKDNGGTILEGYKKLGEVTGGIEGRDELIATLKEIPAGGGGESHKLQPKETYFEWFRYITGGAVASGRDTDGNFTYASNEAPTPNYDTSIIRGNNYISPFGGDQSCSKLYSIMMAMNTENQDETYNTEIEAEMGSAQPATRKFENMLQFLHSSSTDLLGDNTGIRLEKSWVISDSGSVGQSLDWARAGGSSNYLNLEHPAELEKELEDAFTEVISVSSTFVAASVPVNVFNRAESLDNLYIALFEAQDTMRWPGNVKKLKLVDTNSDGDYDDILDSNQLAGFETTGDDRGRISFNALTYWTDAAELPAGDGTTVPIGADGRVVNRGGAGQQIPGFIDEVGSTIGDLNSDTGARQVFVEPASVTNGTSNALDSFDITDALADELMSDLGAADRAEARELIAYGRGQDVDNEDGDASITEARSWILADAIHSKPFALNYGALGSYTEANPQIRLFIGTNDGLFHIIENTTSGGAESGEEVMAFYPRELLSNLKLNRENTESGLKKRYGIDGAPTVMTRDLNGDGTLDHSDGDEAYIYFGLRRGGNSYYALNVSNPATTPELAWKISQTSGGDFDELGMTFADPIVGKVKFGDTATDVLIFSGGYNGGWNDDYTSRVGKDDGDRHDSAGNSIYIVDARTGALIWKAVQGTTDTSSNTHYEHADLFDSIPSRVTVLKSEAGNIHRLYVGDTGGAVWRVDLPEGSGADYREDNWFISKFAELGTDGSTTDRRFFHAPDLVETYDSTGYFDGVLLSSGNRADPLETDVTNYHFYLKDRNIISGDVAVKSRTVLTVGSLADQTDCVVGDEGALSCAASIPNGWKIELEKDGEKGLATPLADGGRVFFTSYSPSAATSCAPSEGESYIYVVNLADGTAAANNKRIYDVGPGIAAGSIVVGDSILVPGGGIEFLDVDGDGDLDNQKLTPSLSKRLYQTYWREPGIDQL